MRSCVPLRAGVDWRSSPQNTNHGGATSNFTAFLAPRLDTPAGNINNPREWPHTIAIPPNSAVVDIGADMPLSSEGETAQMAYQKLLELMPDSPNRSFGLCYGAASWKSTLEVVDDWAFIDPESVGPEALDAIMQLVSPVQSFSDPRAIGVYSDYISLRKDTDGWHPSGGGLQGIFVQKRELALLENLQMTLSLSARLTADWSCMGTAGDTDELVLNLGSKPPESDSEVEHPFSEKAAALPNLSTGS